MQQTVALLQRLESYGVSFHSYTEPYLASDNELLRDILLAVMASLAKLEAQKISERTKAGLARARARARGKRIGRPAIDPELREKIAARVAEVGIYTTAREFNIDPKTAAKYSLA
jgi:DNA invertase Pin-like site-specific DNA recombinase